MLKTPLVRGQGRNKRTGKQICKEFCTVQYNKADYISPSD